MRLASVAESRLLDQLAESEYGIPGETLMEAAGVGAARHIELSFIPEMRAGGIGVVCGPGNNGADGLLVARHLHAAGRRGVAIFLFAPEDKRSPLFRVQLERCRRQGLVIRDALDLAPRELAAELAAFRLLVDAIFGVGFRGRIEEPYASAIVAMNACRAPTVSLDTPSGLDADRGTCETCVRAAMTLTFGLAKPGFFVGEGPAHAGRLRVVSIGLPPPLVRTHARSRALFTERDAFRALPRLASGANKARRGHALLIAGSKGMWGAAALAASSAARIGAGYVSVASHADPGPALAGVAPELLTAVASREWLASEARRWTAAGIGPGLGTGAQTAELIDVLRTMTDAKVVLDADALTVVATEKMFPLPSHWILTPHAGELSRIIGRSAAEIEADRIAAAEDAARLTGAIVLLKGYRTVIAQSAAGGQRSLVIASGNAALAKAGTGDVLTGMITGLLAQGLEPLTAAATGAYVHGRIADEWVRAGKAAEAFTAGDLREILPALMTRLAPAASLG